MPASSEMNTGRQHMSPMPLFVEWQNSDVAESSKSPSPHCSHVLPARLFSQPTSTTQTSNIPAGIPQQQDMLNNNKTISVTSMLLSLTRFSGSSQMTVYYSQFTKSKALSGILLFLGSKPLSSTCDSTTEILPLPSERKKRISIFRTGPMRNCESLHLLYSSVLNVGQ